MKSLDRKGKKNIVFLKARTREGKVKITNISTTKKMIKKMSRNWMLENRARRVLSKTHSDARHDIVAFKGMLRSLLTKLSPPTRSN